MRRRVLTRNDGLFSKGLAMVWVTSGGVAATTPNPSRTPASQRAKRANQMPLSPPRLARSFFPF
jgi:hypothetical protein